MRNKMFTKKELNERIEAFQNEKFAEILPKWSKRGYLESLDLYKAKQISVLLESQEMMHNHPIFDFEGIDTIPLVYEIYKNFIGFDLVSVQSLFGPGGSVQFSKCVNNKLVLEREDICAKTRKLRASMWATSAAPQNWSENMVNIARDVRLEMSREIITDLRNHAGTVMNAKFESPEDFLPALRTMFGTINNKMGFKNDVEWVIIGLDIFEKLVEYNPYAITNIPIIETTIYNGKKILVSGTSNPIDIHCCGLYCGKFMLYVDSCLWDNTAVCGTHGEYKDSYIYSPYMPISWTTKQSDENFHNHKHILTRYGKKLVRSGANQYGRINFHNKPSIMDLI